MDGEIDLACQQRLLDLLGEQPLAAGIRERPVGNPVAGGADRAYLDRSGIEAMRGDQRVADHVGLGQRKRRAACPDPDLRRP